MNVENKTLQEIRYLGLEALLQHLEVVGMIRFLQYQEKGYGDYSKERHNWLGNPEIDEIAEEIKKLKK